MKILINAITAKMGGFKTLINSFIENIPNDNNEYYFLCPPGVINKCKCLKSNIKIIESNKGDINHIERFLWYQIGLPKYIKKNKFDYMINLTNYGPISPGCKEILLLHNSKHVSEEMRKKLNTKGKLKLKLEDFVLKISLKGTDKLIVQTNYMKDGVIKKFKYKEKNISVIPSAPTTLVNNIKDNDLENKILSFLGKEKNVLSNVTLYTNYKNLERLLEAVKYIKENNLCKFKLIMTIGKNEGIEAINFLNKIKEYNIEDYVMSVGNVAHDNLYQILEKSKGFIYPSYAESFGVPFVEAMRFNLPIIAADLGFAHDVCKDAALYFKYDSKEELANRIVELIKNDSLREKLSNNSKLRNEKFNEKQIVDSYLNLIKEELSLK